MAAAIKSEARGLSHAFDIIHVRDGEEPKPKSHALAWAIAMVCAIVLLLVVVGLATPPSRAPALVALWSDALRASPRMAAGGGGASFAARLHKPRPMISVFRDCGGRRRK